MVPAVLNRKPVSLKVLPFLFLLSPLNGFTQETIAPAQSSKFRIGVNGSLEHAFRRAHIILAILGADTEFENMKRAERPGFSSTTSIRAGLALGKRLDLEVGVGYSYRGFKIDTSRLEVAPHLGSWFLVRADGESSFMEAWELHYLDLPVRLTLTLGNGSVRSISSFGITSSFLMDARATSTIGGERRKSELHGWIREHNISSTLTTGVAIAMGERSDLRIEPVLQYGHTSIIHSWVVTPIWSAGVNVGYYRRF
jgi:hypothetical protein